MLLLKQKHMLKQKHICFTPNKPHKIEVAAAAQSGNKNDFREPQIFRAPTLVGFSTTGFRQILREMTLTWPALLCLDALSHETLFLDFMLPVSGHWAVWWWQIPPHQQSSGGSMWNIMELCEIDRQTDIYFGKGCLVARTLCVGCLSLWVRITQLMTDHNV